MRWVRVLSMLPVGDQLLVAGSYSSAEISSPAMSRFPSASSIAVGYTAPLARLPKRAARGVPPLAAAADAWVRADRLLVTSIAHFDRPVPVGRLRPVYVGR